ncbi:hypothetical protein, partial [Cellulomonas algicola]|uniref:hypothetical protein n=1 Tax=Cellulomonas algicola TaxID=2071633 RepID=UPI001B357116
RAVRSDPRGPSSFVAPSAVTGSAGTARAPLVRPAPSARGARRDEAGWGGTADLRVRSGRPDGRRKDGA